MVVEVAAQIEDRFVSGLPGKVVAHVGEGNPNQEVNRGKGTDGKDEGVNLLGRAQGGVPEDVIDQVSGNLRNEEGHGEFDDAADRGEHHCHAVRFYIGKETTETSPGFRLGDGRHGVLRPRV